MAIFGRGHWHTGGVQKWRAVADDIIVSIRRDAARPDGEFSPGQAPLSVRKVMDAYGVSTSTARSVFRNLVAEGWMVSIPDVGHIVAGGDASSLAARVARIEKRLDDAGL